jgi:hypothetical protein
MNLIPDNNALEPDEEMSLPPDAEVDVMNLALNLVKIKMGLPADNVIDDTDR